MAPEPAIQYPQPASTLWLGMAIARIRMGREPWPGCGGEDCHAKAENELAALGHRHDADWSLNQPKWSAVEANPMVAPLLRELHAWAKERNLEEPIMEVLLTYFTPPDEIVEDLITGGILIDHLGHMSLPDRWLGRLGDRVPEAAVTLALRRYLYEPWTADELEEVLHAFRDNTWMLDVLAQYEGSSPEKGLRLLQYIHQTPPNQIPRAWKTMCDWLKNLP